MKTINQILNKTWNWVKENPKKTILGVGLAGLGLISALSVIPSLKSSSPL